MKFSTTKNVLSTAIKSAYQAGIKAQNASTTLANELILSIPHDPATKSLDQYDIDHAFVAAVYELLGVEYADQNLSDLQLGSVITETEHARLRKCKSAALAIIKGDLGYEVTKEKQSLDAQRKAAKRAEQDQAATKYVDRVLSHAKANGIDVANAANELAENHGDKKIAALIKRVPAIIERTDKEARANARAMFKDWVKDASLADVQKMIDLMQ